MFQWIILQMLLSTQYSKITRPVLPSCNIACMPNETCVPDAYRRDLCLVWRQALF